MIVHLLTLLGSLCFLVAALGLFRMPDAYSRIHAATKASSTGVLLLATAALIEFFSWQALVYCFLIVALVFLTAPLACHAIAKNLPSGKKT